MTYWIGWSDKAQTENPEKVASSKTKLTEEINKSLNQKKKKKINIIKNT